MCFSLSCHRGPWAGYCRLSFLYRQRVRRARRSVKSLTNWEVLHNVGKYFINCGVLYKWESGYGHATLNMYPISSDLGS